MSQTKKLSYIYNPANQTAEELIDNFIVRKKEFQKMYKAIKNDDMKYQPQHFLIIANRGNGKTTLLLRVYYEILSDTKLNRWLIPIIFNEEQYHINSLEKLWQELALSLEEADDKFDGLYDEMEESFDEDNYEELCFELLKKQLNKHRKKAVIFIDNIGDMLEKFNKKEKQRLREVLLTGTEFRIVGASSKIMELTYEYSEPFFEFFKEIHLTFLDKKDTERLLLKLGEKNGDDSIKEIIKKEPGRIEALRRITDGVPRTIILLYEIFIDNKNGDSFRDLEEVLDRVTPLYKHRMDDLSPQQQVIIDALAKNWDAMETKELARKTRLESRIVSAQLNSLSKNKIVTKIATNNKNNLYQVSERFFNIWYLMRTGRKRDKNRVMFLTRFIENWCNTSDELIKRVSHSDSDVYARSMFLLQEDEIEKALDVAVEFLKDPKAYEDFNEDLGEFLILLIAKKQYHITKKLFQQSKFDLVDRYKPIYYALMSFLKDENPNEILKMGEEIRTTVEEVVEKINRYSVEYR